MFNIVNTINEIANFLGSSLVTVKGQNKVDALDQLIDSLDADLTQLNQIAIALGGTGTATTIYDALNAISVAAQGASGSYQPVASGTVNIGSIVLGVAQWMRVGSVVIVSGRVVGDPAAAGAWLFELDLPIASNIGDTSNVAGTLNVDAVDSLPSFVLGSAANNTAVLRGTAITTSTAFTGSYIYQYLVI